MLLKPLMEQNLIQRTKLKALFVFNVNLYKLLSIKEFIINNDY